MHNKEQKARDQNLKLSTARELIHWGEEQLAASDLFYGHGTEEPLDETIFLVFSAVGLEYHCPDEWLDRPLTVEQIQCAKAFIQTRIETRKPAAYITGEAWFAGLRFHVDERVLVPRSPFAELIENQFSPWIQEDEVHRILDIGAGSGCIAIACALAFPKARVDAVDVSPGALEVARRNVEQHEVQDRLRLIQSDLFENLQGRRYDLIVSNPPYVPTADVAGLPAEYLHEPSLGLAGGDDGLDIVRRLLAQAHAYLTDNGVLVVEVGDRDEALAAQYPQVPFVWLEFEWGGDGVFLLEAGKVRKWFGPSPTVSRSS